MVKPQGLQTSSAQSLKDKSFVFPKNWYFYREGKVQGPTSIEEIMRAGPKDGQGQKILVSKIGFEKWYPIDDLGELFAAQSQMELETAIEIEQLKKMVQQKTQQIREKQPAVTPRNINAAQQQSAQYFQHRYTIESPSVAKEPDFQAKLAYQNEASISSVIVQQDSGASIQDKIPTREEPSKIRPQDAKELASSSIKSDASSSALNKTDVSTLIHPSTVPGSPSRTEKTSKSQKQKAKQAARAAKKILAKSQAKASTSLPQALPKRTLLDQKTFDQIYVSNKASLRLGRFQNALSCSFLLFPLTLGFFWISWFQNTLLEVYWHVTGDYKLKGKIPSLWLAAIPGVHFYFAYKFSLLLRNAEQQDGYRSTQPWFATWLAVIPPFYMMYMQDQINNHWRQHVLSCWKKQMAELA